MKLHTLTDLEAAHDIDDGFEYVKNNPVLLNYSAAQGIIDTLSAGLSTGAVLANFPAAQPSRNVEKIRIKITLYVFFARNTPGHRQILRVKHVLVVRLAYFFLAMKGSLSLATGLRPMGSIMAMPSSTLAFWLLAQM